MGDDSRVGHVYKASVHNGARMWYAYEALSFWAKQ